MGTHLLQDLAVVMAVAGAMTLLCYRLRQPVVIGYILAGLLIGPYTPLFSMIRNLDSIHTMAELGLVFLLFSLGLEFNLPKIRKVGLSAGLAALLEVILMLAIGYALGQFFGWTKTDSLFLGAILSISSTTIIVKVFMDLKMMEEKFAHIVFGILILEDIVAVAILSILSGLGAQGNPNPQVVALSFFHIGLFVTLYLVLGLLLIPRFIHWVAQFKVKEVLGIVTLGLCLGGALLASFFHLSVALGAFLTGAILAASEEVHSIEEWMYPIRDMFSALFFVSAGMLIQPQLLWEHKFPIAIVTLVTLAGKILSGASGSFLTGYDLKTSAKVGMSLGQIGEFSFVIASLGLSLKITSDFLYPLAIAVSSITTLTTPLLIKNSDRITDTVLETMPSFLRRWLDRYSTWISKNSDVSKKSHGSTIFSKYLVRVGIYGALLSGLMTLTSLLISAGLGRALQGYVVEPKTITGLWTLSALLAIPLIFNIAKYICHIILLLVSRHRQLLHHIDVLLFYNTLNGVMMTLLSCIFLLSASTDLPHFLWMAPMGLVMLMATVIFRRRLKVTGEWLERLLDHVAGLATSEPTRQAILTTGGRTLLLVDMTDQIALPPHSFAHHKKIRDLQLREQTGASIVAIYREGRHIPNPNPDTVLLPDDVLVLLGESADLKKARALILQKS